ncbi:hypothetical protein VTK56DRAFT_6131 [Thermocarpiscus australiensis]
MPNTAPQRGGKARLADLTPHRASSPAAEQALRGASRSERPARSATFHSSFSFESPSASGPIMAAGIANGPSARKRSRTFEASYDGAADDEAHSKGGHSLRKRARVDYTQEMIDDDLGPSAAKIDVAAKSASTPSARGRKRRTTQDRDASGDESEDIGTNPKRRRAEKSPAPARATSSRRRNTSRMPATDVSTYVDQPSDNDVQDTILVNVSLDGGPSEEESDNASLQQSKSEEPSSDESDAARAHVQPPTPQVQPAQLLKDAISVAPEGHEAIAEDRIPGQLDDNPRIELAHISPKPESDQPDQTGETETRRIFVVPTILKQPETTSQQDSAAQPAGTSVSGQNLLEQEHGEAPEQQSAPEPTIESPEPTASHAPGAKLGVESTALSPSQDEEAATAKPIISRTSSRQSQHPPKPAGPARLKQLEHIYSLETPFASHLKLTPYEEEDTVLPGPYTEWVHPVDSLKEQPDPTPVPTPTPAPNSTQTAPAGVEWNARRPLKTGEFFALYRQETKRRQEKGLPPISMVEFNNECARRYKSVHSEPEASVTPPSAAEPAMSAKVTADQHPGVLSATAGKETPQNSQTADFGLPTTVPSPCPGDDEVAPEDGVEEEQELEETVDDQVKTDSRVEPVEVTRNPPKQYAFRKIRDVSEFIEAFEGWQNLDPARQYQLAAAAVEAAYLIQLEHNELRKILDDEENAKRRQANDKTIVNWENRQKADEPLHWRRHFDDVVKGPAPFEVRGARAPKPYVDDPVLEHQREEDRIMAQAYGFKHNNHPTQVGRQNPEEQRWDMSETRLRERKRTEKGAELADENVIEGKRVRKPRYVSDQSKDPSRSGTPSALGFGRRQIQKRKNALTAVNGDETDVPEQAQPTESFTETPRKGRAGRARGMVLGDQDQADNNQTEDEEAGAENKPRVSHARTRGAAFTEPPTSVPAGFGGETTKPKRLRGVRNQQANQAAAEIASSSFYSNASTAATHLESRPSTASSEATAHTAETIESAYSLRDKRKRNFALENDPELEPRPQRRARGAAAQKQNHYETTGKKRAQRKKDAAGQPGSPASAPASVPPHSSPHLQPIAAKFYHSFPSGMSLDPTHAPRPESTPTPAPFLHTFSAAPAFPPGLPPPPPPPPSVKKPITKIKVTNGFASLTPSRTATPANGTSGSNPKSGSKGARGNKSSASAGGKSASAAGASAEPEKPYAEMSKSEKMSWSMKRRWAAGEMQRAVEKRRTTLANKKAEKAASKEASISADPNASGQTTEPNSAGPTAPTTPVVAVSDQSGPFAVPQDAQQPQPADQPQGVLQQPPLV